MPDYRALYFRLFSATETAIEDLIHAQNAAEDAFCAAEENGILLPKKEPPSTGGQKEKTIKKE